MTHELRVEDLGVRYQQATALVGANITVPGGAVTGLVGPNGAGKSSLLLSIYGSVGSTGRVFLDEEEISKLTPAARLKRGIAIVPQGRQLFPRLSVRENLRVMAELLHLSSSAIDGALDRFPILRTRGRSLAGILSGGEQQMLVISRALMGSPKILLLDEMNTGLAPLIVQNLAEVIGELAREGAAVLYAAPEIGLAESVLNRGYVIIRGSVSAPVEDGGRSLNRAYQAAMGVELSESLEESGIAQEIP